MEDAVALFGAALVVCAGGLTYLYIRVTRKANTPQRIGRATRAADRNIAVTDRYIEQVNAATSVEELRRLEKEMGGDSLWAGSFWPSSSG